MIVSQHNSNDMAGNGNDTRLMTPISFSGLHPEPYRLIPTFSTYRIDNDALYKQYRMDITAVDQLHGMQTAAFIEGLFSRCTGR